MKFEKAMAPAFFWELRLAYELLCRRAQGDPFRFKWPEDERWLAGVARPSGSRKPIDASGARNLLPGLLRRLTSRYAQRDLPHVAIQSVA